MGPVILSMIIEVNSALQPTVSLDKIAGKKLGLGFTLNSYKLHGCPFGCAASLLRRGDGGNQEWGQIGKEDGEVWWDDGVYEEDRPYGGIWAEGNTYRIKFPFSILNLMMACNPESKVFYRKMKGDYYDRLVESKTVRDDLNFVWNLVLISISSPKMEVAILFLIG